MEINKVHVPNHQHPQTTWEVAEKLIAPGLLSLSLRYIHIAAPCSTHRAVQKQNVMKL